MLKSSFWSYSEEFLDRHYDFISLFLQLPPLLTYENSKKAYKMYFEYPTYSWQRIFNKTNFQVLMAIRDFVCKNESGKQNLLISSDDGGILAAALFQNEKFKGTSIRQLVKLKHLVRVFDKMNKTEMASDWQYKAVYQETVSETLFEGLFTTERYSDRSLVNLENNCEVALIFDSREFFETTFSQHRIKKGVRYYFACYNQGEDYSPDFTLRKFNDTVGLSNTEQEAVINIDNSELYIISGYQ